MSMYSNKNMMKLGIPILILAVKAVYCTNCVIEGLCNGVVGSFNISDSIENCVLSGRSLEGVTWVSYNLGNGVCSNLLDCPSVDAEIPTTVSSEVSCPICTANGECVGTLLNVELTDSVENCLEKCQTQSGCKWFAYNKNSEICGLLETCQRIDDSEHTWISGEVSCYKQTSITPEQSSTAVTTTTPEQSSTPGTITTPEHSSTPVTTTTSEHSSAPATTSTTSPILTERNQILWIDNYSASVKLVDLNGMFTEACELPKYPAAKGPVTIASSYQTPGVVACGEAGNSDYKECFIFDGIIWEPLPPLEENHYPYLYGTKSFFMDGLGVWVGGENDGSGGMVNELLNSEGQWMTLPVDSPYARYSRPCTMPLNSTHIIFIGGWNVLNGYTLDTWILDMENLVWTSTTPISSRREGHGCVLTDEGEVLIAGGNAGTEYVSSVNIFNPVSLEWRKSGNLPDMEYIYQPSLMLWNNKVLLIESNTDNIWERQEDGEWRLLDASMGAGFLGGYDNAVIVPDLWRKGCS